MLLNAVVTMAEQVEIDGLKYNLNMDEKTASVSSYNTYNGILEIPEKVNYDKVDYTVTAIEQAAFYRNYNLLSVTIPNTVKTINDHAFESCSSLASAKIGDGVEFVGCNAFSNCGLVSLTLGNGIRNIESGAFDSCFGLTQLYISDLAAWCGIEFVDRNSNPLNYSHRVYLNKKEIKELTIPEGITKIKKHAFSQATSITSLTINNDVTSIDNSAFYGCTALVDVIFGNKLASIGNFAFYECSSLESIELADGITTIGEYAFAGCSKLEEIKLPENLKIIKNSAFSGCGNLSDITIPSKVEIIYGNAFDRYSESPLTIVITTEYPPLSYVGSFPQNTTIVVPDESFDLYGVLPWSNYDIIPFSGTGPEKCADPEIIYRDGKFIFSCQTPDVDFHYSVTSEDFKQKQTGGQMEVTATYQVTVYATKAGYEKSGTVTKSITITRMPTADLNNDGTVNAADAVKIVNIIMDKEVYPKE